MKKTLFACVSIVSVLMLFARKGRASYPFSVDGTVLYVSSTSENVGIGTTDPMTPLEVSGGQSNVLSNATGGDTAPGQFEIKGAGGTNADWSLMTNVSNICGANSNSCLINNGTSKVALTATSGGNVGIGQTSPGQLLDVNGTIRQATEKSCTLGLTTNASGDINGCVASDEKLKTAIRPLPYNGELVDALQPSLYNWKHPKDKDSQQHAGFIAEQVEQVFPQAVSQAGFERIPSTYTITITRRDGTKIKTPGPTVDGQPLYGVDPNAMIALLVKEVQSLRQRVAVLEANQLKK